MLFSQFSNLTGDIISLRGFVDKTLNSNRIALARFGKEMFAGAGLVLVNNLLRSG